jgi:hypothetical protein
MLGTNATALTRISHRSPKILNFDLGNRAVFKDRVELQGSTVESGLLATQADFTR